jgi:hypothetical protein
MWMRGERYALTGVWRVWAETSRAELDVKCTRSVRCTCQNEAWRNGIAVDDQERKLLGVEVIASTCYPYREHHRHADIITWHTQNSRGFNIRKKTTHEELYSKT